MLVRAISVGVDPDAVRAELLQRRLGHLARACPPRCRPSRRHRISTLNDSKSNSFYPGGPSKF
jgi:hypothetical protein